jgi:hypothetical protein
MMYFLAVLVSATVVARLWHLRQADRAARPQTWPADLDLNAEAALVRRYLKRSGWTLLPPHPAQRLLVRAQKKNVAWLNLVIQNRTTPGLRVTILDLLDRSDDSSPLIGILTREPITEDHLELVSRGRLFLITHAQLANAEELAIQASRRIQRDVGGKKAETTEPAPHTPEFASEVTPAAVAPPWVRAKFQEGPVRLHNQPFSSAEMIQPKEAWLQPSPAFIVQTSNTKPVAWTPPTTTYFKHAIYSVARRDVLLFGPNHLADAEGNWSLEADGFPGQYIDVYNSKHFQHIFPGPKPRLAKIDNVGDASGREVEIDASALGDEDYVTVEEPVFLATPVEPDNWGRWLSTVVPKAVHFQRTEAHSGRKFFCRCSKPWQTALLNFLGIKNDKLLSHDPGKTYVCRDLRTLTYSAVDVTPTSFEYELYKTLRQDYGRSDETRKGRIFISRAGRALQAPGYRQLMNEEALITTMTALGFAVVEPELLSFEEQIATFANADVVAGLGGAGMYNVLFCHPGTKVIDIESSAFFMPGHSRLFAAMGMQYGIIFGEQDASDPAPIHKRWRVDAQRVADAVTAFL